MLKASRFWKHGEGTQANNYSVACLELKRIGDWLRSIGNDWFCCGWALWSFRGEVKRGVSALGGFGPR